jgi:hypothetical protein
MSEKWTQEMRRIAFARLAMEFGQQYWDKEKDTLPLPVQTTEAAVLEQIATYLTWLTGTPFSAKNVEAQLAWVKTEQTSVKRVQTKQYILCKAAAYEVGLIQVQPGRETTLGV